MSVFKKPALMLVWILLATGVVFAAGSQEADSESNGELVIGAVSRDFNSPFQARLKLGMEVAAEQYPNLRLDVRDGQSDPTVQTMIVENFIAQRVDAILVTPAQLNALVPAVKAANDAGIPVVTVNTRLGEGADVLTYIGADDYEGGRIQGALVDDLLGGEGNIVLLQGVLGSSPQVNREQGLEDYLREEAPGIEIIARQNNDWDNAMTITVMQNFMTRFAPDEIDAVVVQGPYDALAAVGAIKSAGRDELVGRVIAFDLPQEVIDAIRAGDLYGSVLQDPQEQGSTAVQIAYEYLTGQTPEVPAEVWTDLPKVSVENVDQYGAAW